MDDRKIFGMNREEIIKAFTPSEKLKMKGKKYDKGKLRHDLMPNFPIQETIRVLMHGANLYGDFNWRKVPNLRARYYSAAKRHIENWWDGEQLDTGEGGSGLHHLAHAMCCLIFLMQAEKEKII